MIDQEKLMELLKHVSIELEVPFNVVKPKL